MKPSASKANITSTKLPDVTNFEEEDSSNPFAADTAQDELRMELEESKEPRRQQAQSDDEEIESRYSDGDKEDKNVDAGETGTTNDLQQENRQDEAAAGILGPVESTADLIMRRAE